MPLSATYVPRGAAAELMRSRDPEIVLAGPAGTGKSLACLTKVDACCRRWAGTRALACRATRSALSESALVTYEDLVLPPGSSIAKGARRANRHAYVYPNGSELICGGLDKPDRVMSTEFDVIYVQEAVECTLQGWQALGSRLGRRQAMPFSQLLGDCNPSSPYHWLRQRALAGACRMLESRHQDNPLLYDWRAGEWTAAGVAYLKRLDSFTGAQYQRLRLGRWAGAEGLVYTEWDAAIHVVPRRPVPREWPRWWGVDFGFTAPAVWQEWAQDGDGRLFLLREIYRTGVLVEDLAAEVRTLTHGGPVPRAVVCDHDAEDRATLERHLGLRTVAAKKAISPGIQAVKSRLVVAGDRRPRLMLFADASRGRDPVLVDRRRPTSTAEEFDGYVWATRRDRGAQGEREREEPVDEDNHGLDALRYVVAEVDGLGTRELQIW